MQDPSQEVRATLGAKVARHVALLQTAAAAPAGAGAWAPSMLAATLALAGARERDGPMPSLPALGVT